MATNILWCHVEVEHACDALAEQQQALPPDLAQTVADFVRLCRYYIHIGMGQLIPVSTERPAGLALPRHTDIVSAMLAGVSVLTKIATTAHLIRTNVDMLPALKDGDSGCRETPVPFLFLRPCPRGSALGFRYTSPLFGDFYAGESNPQIPAGLTWSRQALHPVCPTVEAYAADATEDGSRLSDTWREDSIGHRPLTVTQRDTNQAARANICWPCRPSALYPRPEETGFYGASDKGALPHAAFEALRQVETLADPFQYVTQGEDPWKNIRQ